MAGCAPCRLWSLGLWAHARAWCLRQPLAVEAALRQDFVPIGIGDKTNIRGEVVFAGYGISAAEYNYDDYKNLDVSMVQIN
jgi:hypothetical protein